MLHHGHHHRSHPHHCHHHHEQKWIEGPHLFPEWVKRGERGPAFRGEQGEHCQTGGSMQHHQPHVFSTSTPWCSLFGFFCPDHPRNLHNNHDHQNYDHQANIFSGSRPPAVGRNLFRQAGNLIWDRDHPFQTSLLIIMSMTSAFSVNLKADAAGVGKVCVQRGWGGRDQHGAAGEEGSSLVIMIKIFRVIFWNVKKVVLHIAVMDAVEMRWPRYFCKLGRLNHIGWQGKAGKKDRKMKR